MTVMPSDAGDQSLMRKSLRPVDIAVLTLSGLSPTSSVFIVGAGIISLAGTGAAIAVVCGGCVAILGALLFAELGAAFPSAGGVYPGVGKILGGGPALVVIALGLVTFPAALAFSALGLVDYIGAFAPGLPRLPVALAALAAAALLASRDIRTNAVLATALLGLELLAVVTLSVLAGAHPVRSLSEVLSHPIIASARGGVVPVPPWTLVLATLSGTYACSGSGLALYFAEEIRGDPRRIGRIVAVISVVSSLLISLPLLFFILAAAAPVGAGESASPIAAFLKERGGAVLASSVSLAVVIAIFNSMSTTTLSAGRFLYSTSREHLWGARADNTLNDIGRTSAAPWHASVIVGLAAGLFCLMGRRALLTVLSGDVFTAALVVVAVVIGRLSGRTGRTSFKSPLFPLAPAVAVALIVVFVLADWNDPAHGRLGLLGLAALALASFVYHTTRRRRSMRLARRTDPDLGS